MAVPHGHLLQASSITVSYDSLTSTNDAGSSSDLAKFTVSATGPRGDPRDPGTLTELVRLDAQNLFKVTAQYTSNSFAPVHDKTWSAKESFTVELGRSPKSQDITVEVVIFGEEEQADKILSFTLFPGAGETIGDAHGDPL